MKRMISLGAALIAIVVLQSLPVESQELRYDGELATELPSDVRAAFVAACLATKAGKAAQALTPEVVEPEVAKLRKEPGMKMDVVVSTFHDVVFSNSFEVAVRAEAVRTTYIPKRRSDDLRRRYSWVLMVETDLDGQKSTKPYLFDSKSFPEFDFKYVEGVLVHHPLMEPAFSAECESKTITAFLMGFCSQYRVEYALPNDDTVINLKLRNRSFVECVEWAGRAARRECRVLSPSGTPHHRMAAAEWPDSGDALAALVENIHREIKSVTAPAIVDMPVPRERQE